MWKLRDGELIGADGESLLRGAPAEVALQDDRTGCGVFLKVQAGGGAGAERARWEVALGRPAGGRFAACYRNEPFWMRPAVADDAGQIPIETQVLFAQLAPGKVALWVPLVDGAARCSFQGGAEGSLVMLAETGRRELVMQSVVGVFVAVFDPTKRAESFFAFCARAAAAVRARMFPEHIAAAAPSDAPVDDSTSPWRPPAFVEKFGWCTWDAFYQNVSEEKMRAGLASFRRGPGGADGVMPRTVILDDGWQTEEDQGEIKGRRLTAYAANGKFGGDLSAVVRMARSQFGVEHFLVWHALQGYWGGVDATKFPALDVRETARDYSPGILHYWPEGNTKWWGASAGAVAAASATKFFGAYHARLKLQGVDGVKVDNQAAMEGLATGAGGGDEGRVAVYRSYREALEKSVAEHFAGNVIHCMSCANDNLYHPMYSAAAPAAEREARSGLPLTRTSTDFWPTKPETHGLHLWTNALVSLWFGHFVHPDWDMFQSGLVGTNGERWGEFHAAARAISGGPLYVSDKPGAQDFALLKRLVCSDGTILRCDRPGAVALESLFVDVLKGEGILKIVNTNRAGKAGVIGLFHCHFGGGPIAGYVSAADLPEIATSDRYVLYFHRTRQHRLVSAAEKVEVTLRQAEYELVTLVPVTRGVAIIGLLDKMNGGQGVIAHGAEPLKITSRDGGPLGVWCERKPSRVTLGGRNVPFAFAANWLVLTAEAPAEIEIYF